MSEMITLEQMLGVLKPNEPITIGVDIASGTIRYLFSGRVENLPMNCYEKYKDYPVYACHLPNYDQLVWSPDKQTADDEIANFDIGLQIVIGISETYPYYKYSVKQFLDTIDDNEYICIDDAKNYNIDYLYEGLKKDISEEILSEIENREMVFAEKPTFVDSDPDSKDHLVIDIL